MGDSCLNCMRSPAPSSPGNPVLQHCPKMKTSHGRAAPAFVPSPQTDKEPEVSGVGIVGRGLWNPPPWHHVSRFPPTPSQQKLASWVPGHSFSTLPMSLTLLPWGLCDLLESPQAGIRILTGSVSSAHPCALA